MAAPRPPPWAAARRPRQETFTSLTAPVQATARCVESNLIDSISEIESNIRLRRVVIYSQSYNVLLSYFRLKSQLILCLLVFLEVVFPMLFKIVVLTFFYNFVLSLMYSNYTAFPHTAVNIPTFLIKSQSTPLFAFYFRNMLVFWLNESMARKHSKILSSFYFVNIFSFKYISYNRVLASATLIER